MSDQNTILERYAKWVYKRRWYIISITLLITLLLGLGALKLKLNTSLRIWFEEGSQEVIQYDNFRSRFAQDNNVIVVFKDERGVFNSDAITVIERLTEKFWTTKYISRVDSLTNYAHTYVDGDSLEIKDLIESRIPTLSQLNKLLKPYFNSPEKGLDDLKDRERLLTNGLSVFYSYDPSLFMSMLKNEAMKTSKDYVIGLLAEVIRKKPLSKGEMIRFIHRFITKDPEFLDRLIRRFYVTEKEIYDFLMKSVTDNATEAKQVAKKLMTSKIGINKLLDTLLEARKKKKRSFVTKIWFQLFSHLDRNISKELIIQYLRSILDKLPPSKEEIIDLITPHIKVLDERKLFVEALERILPPYYDEKTIQDWMTGSSVRSDDLTIFSEMLLAMLPLTEKELKGFMQKHFKDQRAFSELKTILFYTKEELKEKEKIALSEKQVKNVYISEDGKVAVLLLTPQLPDFAQDKNLDLYHRIHTILDAEKKQSGYEFYVGGIPEMSVAYEKYMYEDMKLLMPLIVIFILLTMLLLFRSLAGLFAPMLVIIFATIGTLGLSWLVGFDLDSMSTMAPQVLMAIGIADSIHILTLFFRELQQGKSQKEAMIHSLKLNFLPCFLTSITTSIGFISLLSSISPPIRVFGMMIAVGSLLAFIITVTFLPALLSVLKYSPTRKYHGEQSKNWSTWLGQFVARHRNPIIVSSILFTLTLSYFIFGITPDNNPAAQFKASTSLRKSMDFIDHHIKGSYNIEIMMDTQKAKGIHDIRFLQKVDALQNYIETRITKDENLPFEIGSTSSIVNIIKTLHQKMNGDNPDYYKIPDDPQKNTSKQIAEYLFMFTSSAPQGRGLNNQITADHRMMRLTVRHPITSSENTKKLIERIKSYCKQKLPDTIVHVTGQIAIFAYMEVKMTLNMLKGLAIAFIVITFVLMITFRSIKIGLLSLIPNIIPLLAMFGLIGLTEIPLDGGLTMVALVTLGIVVDDTVHFITKYLRSRHQGKTVLESIYQVYYDVGAAIVFTTMILSVGFAILIFSNFGMNTNFGIFTSITLIVALIMDLLLLPAILLLLNMKKF
ncbi:MAG: hypothetical protein IEMM0008_0776 [bacterium]|nr:MAG: hypothetical protein IEMM0008_0776 [bacterium]